MKAAYALAGVGFLMAALYVWIASISDGAAFWINAVVAVIWLGNGGIWIATGRMHRETERLNRETDARIDALLRGDSR